MQLVTSIKICISVEFSNFMWVHLRKELKGERLMDE